MLVSMGNIHGQDRRLQTPSGNCDNRVNHLFSAHLHLDETAPRLHIDVILFTTESKRILLIHVSLKQAVANQSIIGKERSLIERDIWV